MHFFGQWEEVTESAAFTAVCIVISVLNLKFLAKKNTIDIIINLKIKLMKTKVNKTTN